MTALITGGAGFVGSNVAERLLAGGERVRILDDLSRAGVEQNLAWLEENHAGCLETIIGDVRDPATVARAMRGVEHVFHFAAQVAVTTSLTDPCTDFDVNARGTLNVLEAARAAPRPPSLIYTSTNKVYGALDDVALRTEAERYAPANGELARCGVSEEQPLRFHSPYGCSKGTADQYVLDWAHTFGLRAVVFRMSCIYGPRQFGNEDQGWVAHFIIRALRNEPITIYGDGKQVRDVLFVEDLVDAFAAVRADIDRLSGCAFNVGGGPRSTLSLRELVAHIEALTENAPRVAFEDWRRADQRWYVSDTRALERATGWRPRTSVDEGVARLHHWLERHARTRTSGPASTEAQP